MTLSAVDSVGLTLLDDPQMLLNPHPRFAQLRREAPVSRARARMLLRGRGYLLTSFEDVSALHSDSRFSTDAMKYVVSEKYVRFAPKTMKLLTESMVFKDDPEHKRLRMLVHKAFTPKLVMGMTDDIAAIVEEHIDRIAAKKDVDLVEEFAVQVPLAVIATMLGVSDTDRDKFHRRSSSFVDGVGKGAFGMIRAMPSANRLMHFFDHLAREGRLNPNDGLVSTLVQASEEGDKLTDREVLAMIFLLMLAGHDTTANLIGSSVLALLDNPVQLGNLRDDPTLIDTGIEELLRFTAPVACGTARIALEDVEIGGVVIPRGRGVLGSITSANRDEKVFENPDELDLARTPNKHLAFANGSHYCLGHQLARTEGKLALTALVQKFDKLDITVARESLTYKPNVALRGLTALPMRVG